MDYYFVLHFAREAYEIVDLTRSYKETNKRAYE